MLENVNEQSSVVPVLDAIGAFEPLLKEMKTSGNNIKNMQSAVNAEKERLRALLNRFKDVEAEIRDIAGIVEDKKPKRRGNTKHKPSGTPRPPAASIAGGASRVIREAKEAGKDRPEAKRLATDTALACAKKNHNMSKLTPEVLERIENSLSKHHGTADL